MNTNNNGGTQVVEFGTERTVLVEGGVRRVVWHTPPLDWRAVLAEIGRNLPDAVVEGGCGVADMTGEVADTVPAEVVEAAVAEVAKPVVSVEDAIAAARNVLQDPLLRLTGTHTDRVGGIRLRQATTPEDGGRPSLGQYRDFRDKARSLPQLNAVTIKGILIQTGALDTKDRPTEDGLRAIARAASAYRRANGFGGGDCGPESVELYIRVFRAMGLAREDAETLEGDALQRFYIAYLRVFAS